jgi:spermidine/putrescine-binding protein
MIKRSCLVLLVMLSSVVVPARGVDKMLNVYCWDEYLPKDVLDDFTKRTGIKVTLTLYDSNEVMLAKLASGVSSFDLVFPSEYAVRVLVDRKLVRELDRSKLPNWNNLDDRLLDKNYDPGNRYAVPYFFGTTGIGFNKQAVPGGNVDSWNVMFDPKYSGKLMMLKDMRECFAAALKTMGKSVNEKDPGVLKQAGEILKKQKPLVKAYDSDTFAEELRRGSVVLAHGYNGQLAKLVAEEPAKFGYVVPKEGATVWIDNVCVPAKAVNVQAAHAFINYLLEPETGGRIVNAAHYASANKAARPHVKKEILDDANVYPPDDVLKRCEFMEHLGKAGAVQAQIWREVKTE